MRIYLVGYMASGKSNFGRQLAERLGYKFLDLDYWFEERFRISVLDFFEKYDERAFRVIERSLLMETLCLDNIVVSTGGGTPCFYDNMEVICNAGISVYLRWSVPALVGRLKLVRRKRPLLKDVPPGELHDRVTRQLADRDYYYTQATIAVDGEKFNIENLLADIQARIRCD
jgi:shikimate kinase